MEHEEFLKILNASGKSTISDELLFDRRFKELHTSLFTYLLFICCDLAIFCIALCFSIMNSWYLYLWANASAGGTGCYV